MRLILYYFDWKEFFPLVYLIVFPDQSHKHVTPESSRCSKRDFMVDFQCCVKKQNEVLRDGSFKEGESDGRWWFNNSFFVWNHLLSYVVLFVRVYLYILIHSFTQLYCLYYLNPFSLASLILVGTLRRRILSRLHMSLLVRPILSGVVFPDFFCESHPTCQIQSFCRLWPNECRFPKTRPTWIC